MKERAESGVNRIMRGTVAPIPRIAIRVFNIKKTDLFDEWF